MGFNLFLGCWRQGEKSTISRAELRSLFPVSVADWSANVWNLEYDARNSCVIYLDIFAGDPLQVSGFCVERPCQDMRLWHALMQSLRLGGVAMTWPTGPLVVANMAAASHLPRTMIEERGFPRYVDSGEEILLLVKSSRRPLFRRR